MKRVSLVLAALILGTGSIARAEPVVSCHAVVMDDSGSHWVSLEKKGMTLESAQGGTFEVYDSPVRDTRYSVSASVGANQVHMFIFVYDPSSTEAIGRPFSGATPIIPFQTTPSGVDVATLPLSAYGLDITLSCARLQPTST